jgi:hypothetical protein
MRWSCPCASSWRATPMRARRVVFDGRGHGHGHRHTRTRTRAQARTRTRTRTRTHTDSDAVTDTHGTRASRPPGCADRREVAVAGLATGSNPGFLREAGPAGCRFPLQMPRTPSDTRTSPIPGAPKAAVTRTLPSAFPATKPVPGTASKASPSQPGCTWPARLRSPRTPWSTVLRLLHGAAAGRVPCSLLGASPGIARTPCPRPAESTRKVGTRGPGPRSRPESVRTRGPGPRSRPESVGTRGPGPRSRPESVRTRGPGPRSRPESVGTRGPVRGVDPKMSGHGDRASPGAPIAPEHRVPTSSGHFYEREPLCR